MPWSPVSEDEKGPLCDREWRTTGCYTPRGEQFICLG